ncbi:putative lipoprotein [Pseudomonas protegens Pf-5]|uniref:Putative lipoprotein n=1 Tax=Pseudomonas fluorescens (strain ATCC BAA-477 / NRRL B-23932 / Pf-5) TaxID=220664 RepID=Q4K937_PSEF5|nr:putative lipoprotein [Pseudomonas protegens Pf-5]
MIFAADGARVACVHCSQPAPGARHEGFLCCLAVVGFQCAGRLCQPRCTGVAALYRAGNPGAGYGGVEPARFVLR